MHSLCFDCIAIFSFFFLSKTNSHQKMRLFSVEYSICFVCALRNGLIPSLIRESPCPSWSAHHCPFVTNLSWEKRSQSQLTTRTGARARGEFRRACKRFILFKLKCVGANRRGALKLSADIFIDILTLLPPSPSVEMKTLVDRRNELARESVTYIYIYIHCKKNLY